MITSTYIPGLAIFKGYYSHEFCDSVKNLFDDTAIQATVVVEAGERKLKLNSREAFVKWLLLDEYKGLAKIVLSDCIVGLKKLNLECSKFQTNLQLTKYNPNGHYTWHPDWTKDNQRVGSFVIMLTDDYEGGHLEFRKELNTFSYKLEKGDLALFDSKIWHRVTRVEGGERMTLVGWLQK